MLFIGAPLAAPLSLKSPFPFVPPLPPYIITTSEKDRSLPENSAEETVTKPYFHFERAIAMKIVLMNEFIYSAQTLEQ